MADIQREKEDSSSHGSPGHEEKRDSVGSAEEKTRHDVFDVGPDTKQLNAVFENPLAGIEPSQLKKDVEQFCSDFDLMDHVDAFQKGALIARDPPNGADVEGLTPDEKEAIVREKTRKWQHPWMLYWLVCMCSLGAATQGMDESVNNGAVAIYPRELGFENKGEIYQGVAVSAPYLACAVLGCWLNEPMNRYFGRRGTIFISCFIAAAASVWEAFTYSWGQLFAARFFLGLGIGAKSSTIPVYTAECAPAPIRGALVMQWQVWTAFGIMLGNIMGVAFGGLPDSVNWRYMLGSTVVLPVIVMGQVYLCPESPRWLIQKDRISKAYREFRRIRNTDVQAARDTYYTFVGVQIEKKVNKDKNLFVQFWELFSVPRNRRATWATWIVMFGQQFCGVNVIAYYSTNIFLDGGYSRNSALLVSMGTGILNWVFALPAFFTIDTYGRRFLLLITYPFLCVALLWTGMSFFIPAEQKVTRTAMITTGMYLFEVFYSPGMGPVPFSYSAESFPIQVRDVGMAFATATTWCFNFILALTWPLLVEAFQPQGAFGWYAAWCAILWCLVLLFMPETKQLTLEELDHVFSVPTWKHSSYQLKNGVWHFKKYALFQRDLEPMESFYKGAEKMNAV
ncbi:uncharacterized protein LTR77_002829 [Saxophila tyrrhenica]|uniref:Major facilitator superfamily (MFS) profile domain-containing protein n=1 Tax=Saxophila tyrrhenica TaxID=1690608 RepID=A0AAV9PFQ5_9PEZI|nr:hypothetical protein LTR77_002829 [Saxophila tyrrhenica]